MKTILIILFFFNSQFFIIHYAFSQPATKQWDYRYGGTENDLTTSFQLTTDGGFIIGGHSRSGISGDKTQASWGVFDYWIVKIDSLGIKQWDKDFGGNSNDELSTIQQTRDGGFIIGGRSSSNISGDKTQASWGGFDYWIVKTDSLGIKQWDKRYGGNSNDDLFSIQQATDGGFIIGGRSSSNISGDKTQALLGSFDYWIVKTDSLGIKQWDKRYGGAGNDCLTALQQTTDGGYILAGYSDSNTGYDKTDPTFGYHDYWIIKTDSLGIKQWDKDFGGNSAEFLFTLQLTSDGGYIFGGKSKSNVSGNKTQPTQGGTYYDIWLVKIDSLGNKQWDKDFGGFSDEFIFGNIFKAANGNYLVASTSYSPISGTKTENNLGLEQAWITKIDSSGTKLWDKTILTPGHDEFGAVVETNDGCIAIAVQTNSGIGGFKSQTNRGFEDYWLVKLCDALPLPIELISFTGNFFEGNNILSWTTASEINNSYFSLQRSNNANDFNTITTIPGAGNSTQTLNYSFTDNHPVNGINYYRLQQTDYNGQYTFSNIIALKNTNNSNNGFIIYPNPVNDFININFQSTINNFEVEIMNTLGETILKAKNKIKIDISQLATGVYFLKIINENNFYSNKFIKY